MMTKLQINDIRKRVQAAIDRVGTELGMDINLGNITYNADGFRCQLKGRWEDSIPEVCVDYDSIYHQQSLPPRDTVIEIDGQPHQIYGYKRRATKRPIIVTDLGGNNYVISKIMCQNARVIQEA